MAQPADDQVELWAAHFAQQVGAQGCKAMSYTLHDCSTALPLHDVTQDMLLLGNVTARMAMHSTFGARIMKQVAKTCGRVQSLAMS